MVIVLASGKSPINIPKAIDHEIFENRFERMRQYTAHVYMSVAGIAK
jgi:hypothetical protein